MLQVRSELRADLAGLDSQCDLDAGGAQGGQPGAGHACGSGAPMPTTTRDTPASMIASTHGPVRPVWLQGSRVT